MAVHDRAGWVALFTDDAEINDPVGSRPARGRAQIERFYDTFIAPNTIHFQVEHDFVCAMSVMRDLTLRTTLSTGVVLQVPMHLRYDLVEASGVLQIRRLHAHWELPFMMAALLRYGPRGVWTSLVMFARMLRHLGIGGVLGFMRGFLGRGRRGKHVAAAFLAAAANGDTAAARRLLEPAAQVETPFGTVATLEALCTVLRGARARKFIAAGDCVTATLESGAGHGVALLRFARSAENVSSIQIFAGPTQNAPQNGTRPL